MALISNPTHLELCEKDLRVDIVLEKSTIKRLTPAFWVLDELVAIKTSFDIELLRSAHH